MKLLFSEHTKVSCVCQFEEYIKCKMCTSLVMSTRTNFISLHFLEAFFTFPE